MLETLEIEGVQTPHLFRANAINLALNSEPDEAFPIQTPCNIRLRGIL